MVWRHIFSAERYMWVILTQGSRLDLLVSELRIRQVFLKV